SFMADPPYISPDLIETILWLGAREQALAERQDGRPQFDDAGPESRAGRMIAGAHLSSGQDRLGGGGRSRSGDHRPRAGLSCPERLLRQRWLWVTCSSPTRGRTKTSSDASTPPLARRARAPGSTGKTFRPARAGWTRFAARSSTPTRSRS